MRHIYIALFTMLCTGATGQTLVPSTSGAGQAGMGHTGVAATDLFGGSANQAGLAFLELSAIGISTQRSFFVEGIDRHLATAALVTNSGTFGIQARYFGYPAYNEQIIGVAYGRKLTDHFSIGVQFDYLGLKISEYGTASAFTFEAGLLYELNSEVRVGAHIYNPIQVTIGELENPVPSIFALGLNYRPSEKVVIALEGEKDFNNPLNIKGGIEYRLADWIGLRLGTTTQPVLITSGVGFQLDNLHIDIATSIHSYLGLTPMASLHYEFGKK